MDYYNDTPPDGQGDLSAFLRRYRLALFDVGILDLVGTEWISAGGSRIRFSSLDLRQADKLLRFFEDLGSARPKRGGAASRTELLRSGQLELFSGYHKPAFRHGGRVASQ